MALTARESFKVGFLLACADRGLDGPASVKLMQKAASLLAKQAEGGFLDHLGSAASTAGTLGTLFPIAAGAGVGYLAHKAMNPDIDEDDVKKQELIEELRHYTRRAREHQRMRAMRSHLGIRG